MRLLLDTHVLLWLLAEDPILNPRVREAVADQTNEAFLSAVSVWEIAIKRAQDRLRSPDNLIQTVANAGLRELAVTFFHAEQAGALPPHHKDPFDRMLIAQAQAEGLVLVTADRHIPRYGVRTMPATH